MKDSEKPRMDIQGDSFEGSIQDQHRLINSH